MRLTNSKAAERMAALADPIPFTAVNSEGEREKRFWREPQPNILLALG